MLEAIAAMGKALLAQGDPVEGLIKAVSIPKGVEQVYVVKLDLRLENHAASLSAELKEADQAACIRYRWVGNAVGNRPQIFLTTDNLDYLVGPAVPNLLATLQAEGKEAGVLGQNLQTIKDNFFRNLPDGKAVLDLEKLKLVEKGLIDSIWEKAEGASKKALSALAAALQKSLLARLGLKKAEVALWTLCFNGQPLATLPEYSEVILNTKEGAFDDQQAVAAGRGICSICGRAEQPVITDFSQLVFFKQYINDKIGFASGLHESGFAKNYAACRDCFRGILLAEVYLPRRMQLNIGPLSLLVLPAFLSDRAATKIDIVGWAESLHRRVGTLANTPAWLERIGKNLEEALLDELEEWPQDDLALVNLLFYHKTPGRSEFRILELIRDVAPSRIKHLLRSSNRLNNWAEKHLGPDRWWLDLNGLYRLIPLHEGQQVEYKKLLHIYRGLLTASPLPYRSLVRDFVHLAKIYHTRGFQGTNIKEPGERFVELEMSRALLKANLFLTLLSRENILKGGSLLRNIAAIGPVEELADAEMKGYLEEMGYDKPQAALFLLGYLLNQVGRAQVGAGYEHKPVLDKVNFSGMSWNKVLRLSNIAVDLLRQHKLFRYYEKHYAALKQLLDEQRERWPLTPEENVFYLLSGYAWATRRAYKVWAEKRQAGEEAGEEPLEDKLAGASDN